MNKSTVKISLEVSGMTCSSCVNTITKYISGQEGIDEIKVNLLGEKAEIEYDPQLLKINQLTEFFEDVGFSAKPVEEAPIGVINLDITGMTCSSCTNTISKYISSLDGVSDISVNLSTERARIEYNPNEIGVRDLIEGINDIGYGASISKKVENIDRLGKREEIAMWKKKLKFSSFFTIPFVFMMIFMYIPKRTVHSNKTLASIHYGMEHQIIPGLSIMEIMSFLFVTPIMIYVGKDFYIKAYKSVRNKSATMDVLVSLGTVAAYLYSIYQVSYSIFVNSNFYGHEFFGTSAFLFTFITFGKYMEAKAKGRTSESMQKLLQMQVKSAILLEIKNGKVLSEKEIDIELIQIHDILKVYPGQKIPTDGVIIEGNTSIDESMITGESMPVSKHKGDEIIGSTINQQGVIHMKVTRVGADTALNSIVRLVQDAQISKAPVEELADKVSAYFVPMVVLIAVINFTTWYILLIIHYVPKYWIPIGGDAFLMAFLLSLSVLVIACPCALGLATPAAVSVASGVGAELGILIKGAAVLQKTNEVNTVILDKTGTITHGKPKLTDIISYEINDTELLEIAATIELGSEHPLGKAIVTYARENGTNTKEFTGFEAIIGMGIKGSIDGIEYHIGTVRYILEKGIKVSEKQEIDITNFEREGKTTMLVASDKIIGLLAVADTIKDESIRAISKIKSMGIDVFMLTGDNKRTADSIAEEVGIPLSHVYSELMPNAKAKIIKDLQNEEKVVAMVGDGTNDSPALAQADIGIAIGAGTDVAIETADMILVKNDLRDVVIAIDLSKKTFKRIKLNYAWAFGYNILAIPIASGVLIPIIRKIRHLTYLLPPEIAGLAMSMSSVSVVISSLLLKKYQPPKI